MKCSNCGSDLTLKPRKKKAGAIVIGIVLALLVVAVVILLVLFGNKWFSGRKEAQVEAQYLTYVKDGFAYQINKDKKKPFEFIELDRDTDNEDAYQGTEPWCTTSNHSDYYYTEDGTGLYFIFDNDLYYKNLKKIDNEAERIEKNVIDFYPAGKDTLVYIKGDDRRLYVSKAGKVEKIDKEVSWYICVSDDGTGVFYNKQNDDYTYDCYYLSLKNLYTECIIKEADDFRVENRDHIVYCKDEKLYLLLSHS